MTDTPAPPKSYSDQVWTLRTLYEAFPEYLDAELTLGVHDAHGNFEIAQLYRGYMATPCQMGGPEDKTPFLRLDGYTNHIAFRKVPKK